MTPDSTDFDAAAYVTVMAQVLDLPIPDDIKASVIENFCQIHAIAQPVIHFSFPDDLEAAPIFKP